MAHIGELQYKRYLEWFVTYKIGLILMANTPAGVLMARGLQAANYGCLLLMLNPVTTYIVVALENKS